MFGVGLCQVAFTHRPFAAISVPGDLVLMLEWIHAGNFPEQDCAKL